MQHSATAPPAGGQAECSTDALTKSSSVDFKVSCDCTVESSRHSLNERMIESPQILLHCDWKCIQDFILFFLVIFYIDCELFQMWGNVEILRGQLQDDDAGEQWCYC